MALLGVQGYRSVDLDLVPNILNMCQKWLKFAAANEHGGIYIYIYIYMGETPTGGHILVKYLNFSPVL